ncbi:MAG: hypothetical protein AAFU61_17655, partial [Pseudomonadota bacterium]
MKTAITALAIAAGTTASAQTLTAVSSSNNFASEVITVDLPYDGNAMLDTWAPGDMFGRTSRGAATNGLPFAMADDSASIFPGDTAGIIGEADLAEFFGVVDTVNGDNGSGFGTADYTFADTGANTIVSSFSVDVHRLTTALPLSQNLQQNIATTVPVHRGPISLPPLPAALR